jgi:prolyl-tRNA editing enzyme YbaK/EbsC (Cys-tRNA(Pro) deacylase)
MSTEQVQAYLDAHDTGLHVIEPEADTSTVVAAAAALGVEPAQIAKTLALRAGHDRLLLVTGGLARLDNASFRARFGAKPTMLRPAEVEEFVEQPIGGVSPFGHPDSTPIYCDESLRDFDIVYPAGGSPRSAVRIATEYLAELVGAQWVHVTRSADKGR